MILRYINNYQCMKCAIAKCKKKEKCKCRCHYSVNLLFITYKLFINLIIRAVKNAINLIASIKYVFVIVT